MRVRGRAKMFEEILAKTVPNLIKTIPTVPGSSMNDTQKKYEENHTTYLNCSKPVIKR